MKYIYIKAMNARQERVVKLLDEIYPQARIALKYKSPWQLLVAVVLSAQCTDNIVNKVTENLFHKYKTLDDYFNADIGVFENDIRQTGFYRNKAKNILKAANLVKTKYKGLVPDNMKDILSLPGVARKTANVVLGNAYNVEDGIACDTHVIRISQRLGLVNINKVGGRKKIMFNKNNQNIIDFIKDADPIKIENQLMEVLPRNIWFKITYQIIDHGRNICKARNPKCNQCQLNDFCPSSRI